MPKAKPLKNPQGKVIATKGAEKEKYMGRVTENK